MNIVSQQQALNITKPSGIKVLYYLFNEYELHYNEQPANTKQDWHHHEKISETIYIIDNELTLKWKENDKIKSIIVRQGDLIETQKNPHCFSNNTNRITKFIVFKQVFSGQNKKEILKNDKILDE